MFCLPEKVKNANNQDL